MYDRRVKSFRDFLVYYGPDGIGKHKVQARSSLEAGVIFQEHKPQEMMYEIRDTL